MMKSEETRSVLLELSPPRSKPRAYLFWGLGLGALTGVLLGHPIAMVVQNIQDAIIAGAPLAPLTALRRSFHVVQMWPMALLYTLAGGVVGAFLGYILQRLREHELLVELLYQEFELQVATLRHHYKNLAIGIHGLAGRIKKKLNNLDKSWRTCLVESDCPTYEGLHAQLESLDRNVIVLEEAAQRLKNTLGQELLFLKALTDDALTPSPQDFYPFLSRCIEDLLGMRFREEKIRVEINGQPAENCRDSITFPFEPHTMEVILQNVLANAMRYGDHIQIRVTDLSGRLRVEVRDNGPGMDIQELKRHLSASWERREAESTHLGLRVTIHLLAKIGGSLAAWSGPGAGAIFSIEFPKRPSRVP
jgi:signal transduction histidine kinase